MIEVTNKRRNIHVAPQDGDIKSDGGASLSLKSIEIFLLFQGKDQKKASSFPILQVIMWATERTQLDFSGTKIMFAEFKKFLLH